MDLAIFFPTPTLSDMVIGGIVLLSTFISWFYFIKFFSKVQIEKDEIVSEVELPSISIIICAKNEIKNLQENLTSWLKQDYPVFEVVIADDGSIDGSGEWLSSIQEQDSRVKAVILDADYIKYKGKKMALTLAIKAAKYPYFVLTDADCKPSSNVWLRHMASPFSKGKDVVIGYSPAITGRGLLGLMIKYEGLINALQYLGHALAGKPYMGVGRNLAYSRKCYDNAKGFSAHYHIPAGDDDLFVQQVANKNNTKVVIDENAWVYTTAKKRWGQWWQQKKRHLYVGKYYKTAIKNSLSLFHLSQILFWVSILLWFLAGTSFIYPAIWMLIRFIPEWIIWAMKAKILKQKRLGIAYPFLNLIFTFIYSGMGIGAFFAKKIHW